MAHTPQGETLTIPAADGLLLAATLFRTEGPPRARVIINSAMGVKRGFYARFAAFLAEQGFETLTWDYRGTGDTKASKDHRQPSITVWGAVDFAGVLEHGRRATPERPVLVLGHSVGGQLFGLAPNAHLVSGWLGIAAQCGDWRYWPGLSKAGMWALWHVGIPVVVGACGRLPGWAGVGNDVPAGVAREWAKWGRTPGYLAGGRGGLVRREAFARVRGDVALWSIGDDLYAPAKSVDALGRLFGSANTSRRTIDPKEVGRPVGHFGLFRDTFRESLWAEAARWLEARIDTRVENSITSHVSYPA